MQTVRQLDQDHPKVFGHRHKQLAEILGLLGFGRIKLQVCQLGNAIHQLGNVTPKDFFHLGIRCLGVFDGVMQQCGDDRGIVQLLFRQNGGNRHGMREIGLA